MPVKLGPAPKVVPAHEMGLDSVLPEQQLRHRIVDVKGCDVAGRLPAFPKLRSVSSRLRRSSRHSMDMPEPLVQGTGTPTSDAPYGPVLCQKTTADDGQWPFFSSLSVHYQDGCHTTSHTTFWCNTTCNTTVGPPHRPDQPEDNPDCRVASACVSVRQRRNSVFVLIHTIRGFGLSERFTRSFGEALDGGSGQDFRRRRLDGR